MLYDTTFVLPVWASVRSLRRRRRLRKTNRLLLDLPASPQVKMGDNRKYLHFISFHLIEISLGCDEVGASQGILTTADKLAKNWGFHYFCPTLPPVGFIFQMGPHFLAISLSPPSLSSLPPSLSLSQSISFVFL